MGRDSWTAAIVVLAAAEAANHAERLRVLIGGHDRVLAIGLARAAVVFERLPSAVRADW